MYLRRIRIRVRVIVRVEARARLELTLILTPNPILILTYPNPDPNPNPPPQVYLLVTPILYRSAAVNEIFWSRFLQHDVMYEPPIKVALTKYTSKYANSILYYEHRT